MRVRVPPRHRLIHTSLLRRLTLSVLYVTSASVEPLNQLPDPAIQAPYEAGYPLPEAPRAEGEPPGGGKFQVPHFESFGQIVNLASRTYRWAFDEALKHSRTNALAIRRDPVVMDALRARQIPLVQLPWHIEVDNDQDQLQVQAAKDITEVLNRFPRWQQFLIHLSEAIFYGRYGSQLAYQWDFTSGKRRLLVRDHRPINGDKLIFRYSGEVGVLVHATFPGTWQITDMGRAHFFTPEERETLVVHRHEPEDADFFEGELAGAVNGVGLRSRLYWLWFLRQQVTSWMMQYLQRVGAGGFTIYFYEMGNPQSKQEVQSAAQEQFQDNTILFPRYRDNTTGGPGIQRVEPSTAGAQLLQSLITGYFDEVIRRFILGQNLTREVGSGGLGSKTGELDEATTNRIIKYDAVGLQETITTDLVCPLTRYNHPQVPERAVRFVFDVDKPNVAEILESAEVFYNLGGTLDEDELRSVTGLAKPAPGKSMLAKMQSMSPASAMSLPTGVPMLGQPGPAGGGQPAPSPSVAADPAGSGGQPAPDPNQQLMQ